MIPMRAPRANSVRRTRAAAFTLIEIMVAVALSAVIIVAAFSAFRTATSTLQLCQRLSEENAAFRTGFVSVLDENDSWKSIDDSQGSTLLTVDGNVTWLSTTNNRMSAGDTVNDVDRYPFQAFDFSSIGAPSFHDWRVHEPSTWYRLEGLLNGVDNRMKIGHYWLLQRYGHPDSTRAWLPAVLREVWRKGGVYALIEMLPAGTTWSYYIAFPGIAPAGHHADETTVLNAAGLTPSFDYTTANRKPTCTPYTWGTSSGIRGQMDLSRLQMLWSGGSPYSIAGITSSPNPFSATPSDPPVTTWQRRAGWSLNAANSTQIRSILDQCRISTILRPSKAAMSPQVMIANRRIWAFQRPMNYCGINIFNPRTGASLTLSFHCTGTTLRGARMQRGIDPQ